jgi:uncharacterized RDD family membrane protein YckC
MSLMKCRVVSINGEEPLSYVQATLRESPWFIDAIFSASQSHWNVSEAPSVVGVANIWTASTVIWILLNRNRKRDPC